MNRPVIDLQPRGGGRNSPPDPQLYEFNEFEFKAFSDIGNSRMVQSTVLGRQHRNAGEGDIQGFHANAIGVLGEFIVSRTMNLCWSGGVGDTKVRDVGYIIDVRTTDHPDGRLCVHKWDPDNVPFVFVRCPALPKLWIMGWQWSQQCKREEYWEDPTKKKRPAYFVPNEHLRPLSELQAIILDLLDERDATLNQGVS